MHQRLILTMTCLSVLAGLALAQAPATSPTAPKVVKLKELIAAIKEQKGKVVVIDFWSDG